MRPTRCLGAALLAIALVSSASACDVPVGRERTLGTYVFERGPATDTLIVRGDGRWERRFAVAGRRVVRDSGRWAGETELTFEGFDPELGTDGRGRPGLTWGTEALRPWFGLGATRLDVNEDMAEYYVRVGPPI